jgi:hypothetical protein
VGGRGDPLDGEDREIAYDPARFQVLRAARDSFDSELRALFAEHGWRRFGVDSEGAELWVRDLDQTGLARLDRLRSPAVPSAGSQATGPRLLVRRLTPSDTDPTNWRRDQS